jgi:hypothetical protein
MTGLLVLLVAWALLVCIEITLHAFDGTNPWIADRGGRSLSPDGRFFCLLARNVLLVATWTGIGLMVYDLFRWLVG